MRPTPPTVSIGVPVLNAERFISGALEMLARQTFTDYEIVIIDNGSHDGTAAICQAFAARDERIRYIRFEDTVPLVDNFWRAFDHSRGRYFLWNAADDRRPPDALERATAALERHPEAVLVHGPVEVDLLPHHQRFLVENDVEAAGRAAPGRVARFTRRVRHNAMLYGLYRREALQRAVFRQHVGQDFLVCLQLALIGPIVYVARPLIQYLHANGPVDDPMYRCPTLSMRAALAWPRNRFKCAIVMGRGCWYLLREHGTPLGVRIQAAVLFAGTFARRFRRHLAGEAMLALAAPVALALWPITRTLRRAARGRIASLGERG
jgi:glycosyltransferase involved in cell wall biosynthesis